MTMLELFTRLNQQGIKLEVKDNNLKINAPKSKLTPGLIKELKEKKQELITFLQNNVQNQEAYVPIEAAEQKEYDVLSSAQKRLYILQQMEPGTTGYNIPAVFILAGDLDRNKFQETFKQLIHRHESLRTSFNMIDGEPVQQIQNNLEFKIQYHDISGTGKKKGTRELDPLLIEPTAALIRSFIRPFDLSHAPLIRVDLIKQEEQTYLIMVDMHHIISDGISIGIITGEFMALYAGEELNRLSVGYRDYSQWQQKEKAKESMKLQEAFWLHQFNDEPPVLNLPTDYLRPMVQGFEGKILKFGISKEETLALNALAMQEGVTLFMLLLSIYNVLLSKLGGQEDVVVGTPTAGRSHEDLRGVVGMFVNTLPLRNYPRGNKPFKVFLEEVKARTLAAFSNQDYQYEELVEKVIDTRDAGRNPLFDTMFVMQNLDVATLKIPGLKMKPYEYERETAKFDLTLECTEFRENLSCLFEYTTKLFKPETMQRFTGYFKQVISMVLERPTAKISGIEIISREEKQQVLFHFNETGVQYPADKTIRQLFEEQVEKAPFGIALNAHGEENTQLSYREFNRKANRLAAYLGEKNIRTDGIAAIMTGRSLEMVIGILGILKADAAYLPISPDYPEERIKYMLNDSRAGVLVTTASLAKAGENLKSDDRLKNLDIVFLDFSTHPPIYPTNPPFSHPHRQLAYVIYTSGSTGRPKGVMVQQGAVVNLLDCLNKIYPLTPEDTYLLKTSYIFDVSVSELFGCYPGGGRLAVLEPGMEKDPERIIAAVETYRVTHINFVPSMFTVFLDTLTPGNIHRLSSLKYIFLAGETLSPGLVKKFHRLETAIKLENIYGPTEAAVYTTNYSLDKWDQTGNVPIGKPLANAKIYILDQYEHIQPMGIPGELAIAGAGLARGYLNRPELTAEKFWLPRPGGSLSEGTMGLAPLFFKEPVNNHKQPGNPAPMPSPYHPITPLPHSPLYRTGDLARWLADGNIEFLGRIDHQVKIRGFRIELGEIENQLLTHREVKEAILIAGEGSGSDKYLCAYIVGKNETTTPIDPWALREYLADRLPDYMLPTYFVQLAKIPLTPSGKINRKALPGPGFTATSANYVPPGDEIEMKLARIWSELLGIETRKIGIHDNFFQLGGHSLKATSMMSNIHKEFDIKVNLLEIFTNPTIRRIASLIETLQQTANREKYVPIEVVEQKQYHVLSSAQKRLYILQQLEPGTTGYNIPAVFILEGKLDRNKFQETFKQLIHRHESLRTSFNMIDGEPVQQIQNNVEFKIQYHDIPGAGEKKRTKELDPWQIEPAAALIRSFIRPFDLTHAPLIRVELVKKEEQTYLIMVDMHHIISDGTSIDIIAREFVSLYAGEKLNQLSARYRDYSHWQQKEKRKESRKLQEAFWLHQFNDEPPVLNLPTDYLRPMIQGFEGKVLEFAIGKEKTQALNAFAMQEGVTLFMLLLSIYNVLLSKLGGQEDVVVGTPTAGRTHEDLRGVVGMFVNTLPLRNYPRGNKPFKVFLEEVKARTLAAFSNQDYQYEELVEKVIGTRDASRNPLFDTMFVMQNLDGATIEIPGLKMKPYEYERDTAKFDLTLECTEFRENLSCLFEYTTKLFKPGTMQRFTGYFKQVIAMVLERPTAKISGIEIISREEKQQVLFHFNETGADYPKEKTIRQLFEEQVEKAPGRIAVNACGNKNLQLSYRELNRKSNRLAAYLEEKGIQADSLVGIILKRSIEMTIGILAILKADAAYLPISPDYPEERVNYILADSNVKIVVTTGNPAAPHTLNDDQPNARRTIKSFDQTFSIVWPPAGPPQEKYAADSCKKCRFPPAARDPHRQLAYVIYTSGSTGRPKGVMVQQGAVVNLLYCLNKIYPLTPEDTYLLKTSYIFDVSVTELFGCYPGGGRLAVLEPGMEKDPERIIAAVETHRVTHINFVPSMFTVFLDTLTPGNIHRLSSLKYIFLAGETLSPGPVKKFHRLETAIKLENIYGPTEAAVYTTNYSLDKWDQTGNVPIGKPLANVKIYILDQYEHIQPMGIPGELSIAGPGLARGYLNNPELTGEKFCLRRPGGSFEKPPPGPPQNFLLNHLPLTTYHSPIYRTGDLARWLADGNIEFLGRIDHQVKIRGFRIELGEIENQLLTHREVKEAILIAGEGSGSDKYLCAYIVAKNQAATPIDPLALREYLADRLPDYMLPTYFVQLAKIPLTPSGKINRKALPGPGFTATSANYVPPGDEIEMKLARIWSELLGIETGKIGIHDNFFQLGGHSLKATTMMSKIHKELEIKTGLAELFKNPTICALAGYIKKCAKEKYLDIEAAEERCYYELSYNQKRLWFIQQLDPGSSAYNMPGTIILEHNVDRDKIKKILQHIIDRHESFRTGFIMVNDEPAQVVRKEVGLPLETIDLSSLPGHETRQKMEEIYRQEILTPFDLAKIPLLRAILLKTDETRYVLIFNMHHIISDGWSSEILKKEFSLFQEGNQTGKEFAPGPLKIRYKDFAAWHNKQLNDSLHKAHSHRYWKTKLQDDIPEFTLPGDFSTAGEDRQGAGYQCFLDKNTGAGIKQLAQHHNTTLFMVIFSTYIILLARFSGEQEVACSIIGAGREHSSLHHIVGFFVNSIIYNTQVDFKEPFQDFLERVNAEVLELLQHRDYPLELVFEELRMRYPEISVTFNMLNTRETTGSYELESFAPGHIQDAPETKFDLEPYISEYKNGIHIFWSYKKNRYRPGTIAYFAEEYIKLLDFFSKNPMKSYLEYRRLKAAVKPELPGKPLPLEPGRDSLPAVFAHQVKKTPGRIAVREGDAHYTYGELDNYSSRIAAFIEQKTRPQPGNNQRQNGNIGLLFQHGYHMVAAIIGTLKAGNVYVPLSASYPVTRLSFMLSDSESSLILTNTKNIQLTKELANKNQIDFGDVSEVENNTALTAMTGKPGTAGDSTAYILYTSGSTGNPKGVVQNHHNVLYYTRNWTRVFSISPEDKMTLFSSFCHDGSVQDMFGALLNGAALYLYDVKNREDSAPDLSEFLIKEKITIWHSVPSLFGYFVNNLTVKTGYSCLRFILLGGEPLREHEVNMAGKYFPGTTLANIYGQTESSVNSIWLIHPGNTRGFDKLIIGEPLDNTGVILLDEEENVVGPFETGEIVVASPHVSTGYWKNAEVTRKVFYTRPGYGKMYRTGDLGRLLPEGSIQFIGRKDNQVKLRGFRIELGEIESQLLKHKNIAAAIVKVLDSAEGKGDNYLCAYIVCHHPDAFDQKPAALSSGLKAYLAELLPDYMVPTYFIRLERLPLTPGGKIDRKALPEPEIGEINRGTYIAPRTIGRR